VISQQYHFSAKLADSQRLATTLATVSLSFHYALQFQPVIVVTTKAPALNA